MNLIPELRIGLFNGLLPFVLYLLIFAITIFSFTKEKRLRLYDRKNWTRKQIIYTLIAKIFALSSILLIIFTPLSDKLYLLVFSGILFILGASIMVSAIITFCSSSLETSVETGLYKYSRNPQMIGIWMIFFSIAFSTASILTLLTLALQIIFHHQSIKAEEERCLCLYGDSYKQYLKKVPRYFKAV